MDNRVLEVIRIAQEIVIDYDKNGAIDCVDSAVAFKLVWDQKYDTRECDIMRNYNPRVYYKGKDI